MVRGVCNTHGREKKMHTKFWLEDMKENQLGDLGADGRTILQEILRRSNHLNFFQYILNI
jgi:hypothetical protein